MAESNKVQLKREEVVGNEVVLSDIFPKTNISSIEDNSRGISLNQTLDRIFNDINDKLSRIVNSVNGRTGVVVLTAEDVGLGDVTNISFTDIKQWVLDQLKKGFNDHRLQLFNNLGEVTQFANSHGEQHDGTPFYSECGNINDLQTYNDYKAYIGVFVYDSNLGQLTYYMKPIKVIGKTDNSVLYDEKVGDKDYRGGMLGVNIYKYEDALKIMNPDSTDKSESGLYIDKTKLVGNTYFFDGVYGNGDPTDPDALLYFDTTGVDLTTVPWVTIRINGEPISRISSRDGETKTLYLKHPIRLGDTIITNFSDENYYDPNPFPSSTSGYICRGLYEGMVDALTCRQPALGIVTAAPDAEHPNRMYTIDFYQFKPNVFHGLKLYDTNNSTGTDIGVDIIQSKLTRAQDDPSTPFFNTNVNVSGINAFEGENPTERTQTYDEYGPGVARTYSVVLPSGVTGNVFNGDTTEGVTSNGLHVSTNYSLCIIPRTAFDPIGNGNNNNAANYIKNWPITAPDKPTGYQSDTGDTLIGVNLEKHVSTRMSGTPVSNMSGLRITTENGGLSEKWFGVSDDDATYLVPEGSHTGGLSVNVGKFLDIGLNDNGSDVKYNDEYYEDGKVNVRIKENGGLTDAGDNDLKVELYQVNSYSTGNDRYSPGGGLSYEIPSSSSPDKKGLSVARGLGLRMSTYKADASTVENSTQLAVSIFDPGFADDDILATTENIKQRMYGGLRYLAAGNMMDFHSAIGIRVNETNDVVDDGTGDKIRRGTQGLCITANNVLGIQLKPDGGLAIDEDGCLINTGSGGGGGGGDFDLGPGLYWG